jgi:hypothetical protein
MALSAADFAALNPYQQQAYLNGDPNYASAGPAAPTVQQQTQATLQQLTASENFITIPFGASMETVWTLESYLSQWAAGSIAEPASLQGQDPLAAAAAVAADRCAVIPTPDCANAAALAAQYGQQVANALAAQGYTAPAPAAAAPAVSAPATTIVVGPAVTPSAGLQPALAPAAPLAPSGAGQPAPGATAAAATGTLAPRFAVSGGDGGDAAGGVLGTAVSTALDYVPIIGPILGALFGSLFGGTDLSGLTKAVNQLAQETAQLGDDITRLAWHIANGLGALWRAIATIWDNFLDQLWSVMKSLWKLLWCLAATVIPKIIQIMKDLRKFLDWLYQNYIRKIMNYLQLARRWLQILKLLHIPFASKLDSIITQIQGALFTPFLYVLRWLNGYGAWYNVILTADLTLQRPVFIRTMYAYQADWINMFWTAQTGAGQSGAQSLPGAAAAPVLPAQEQSDFKLYATAGAGPYADRAAQAKLILAAAAAGQ